MPISVSIVEDNDKLRGTLAQRARPRRGIPLREPLRQCRGRARRICRKVKPDVVLMDINLPGMNGVECVRQLKVLLPANADDDAHRL